MQNTYNIIGKIYDIVNSYKEKNQEFNGSVLHDMLVADLTFVLQQQGYPAASEVSFRRPDGLSEGKPSFRKADVIVDDNIIVEVKTGGMSYLYSDDSYKRFVAQCLQTLQYSGRKYCLLVRILDDGNYIVRVTRVAL